jgi:hypothetical protein
MVYQFLQHEGQDKKVEQHRLKCSSDAPGVLSTSPDSPIKDFSANPSKQLSDLSIQVNNIDFDAVLT